MTSPENHLIELDRALWQAAMDRRLDDFRALMAPDYQGLYARGFVTAENDASVTGTMTIRGFRFEDVRVRDVGSDAALVTYITVLDAVVGDREISGRYASTSLWERAADRRHLVYHAEARLP